MRTNRLVAGAVLAVLGMSGLTACGSEGDGPDDAQVFPGLSAKEILTQAQRADEDVTSVLSVTRVQLGQTATVTTVSADSKGNCEGRSVGGEPVLHTGGKRDSKDKSGGSAVSDRRMEIKRRGSEAWLKMSTPAAGALADGGASSADLWVAGDADELRDSLSGFCDMGLELLTRTDELGGGSGAWVRSGTTEIGGVRAVLLSYRVGGAAAVLSPTGKGGETTEVAVAAEGPARLLSVRSVSATGTATIRYTDFDKPVTVTPPPADQIRESPSGLFD
ncbi:hypothetical protein [Streptomyces sp. TLI_171]|uniref:hypothetical protein n=1 Tax=Streptomyces sp. TLI_171 TaxID=1938859 RepID=UPI000C1A6A24|nr:hypothetical protein [Streptomyces sp. TLI_171]RKE19427.1 hypothetical protein BX266_2749 [Streptomyces sp. TLI_171]